MLRESDQHAFSPLSRFSKYNPKKLGDSPVLSEWKFALIGLVLSLIIISAKVFYAYIDYFKHYLIEPRLVSYEVLSEDGRLMFTYAWKSAVKYSNIWLPILCGVLTTYFTWMMVYLDSEVPGVQPPSPLSPQRYKKLSGHTFHINYVFAVLIGVLVTLYMYWRNISIQF